MGKNLVWRTFIKMNRIILTAETDFHDRELREWFEKMQTQIQTMNERTKLHTLEIRKLKNKLKEVKNGC